MINFTHYIKARSVADTYLEHIKDLNGTAYKQHFMSRLNLCEGFGHLLQDNRVKTSLFSFTLKSLTKHLTQSFDEIWSESMERDDFGYKKEIKKDTNDDIKFYFGMTEIIGEVNILIRNGIELPEGIEKKINRRFLLRMIDIANDDNIMRDLEGTTYVNGIGGIMCLKRMKNSLVPLKWETINDCYKKIWGYYLTVCKNPTSWLNSKRKTHNRIYGLTHCVINLTNFYTRFIMNDEIFLSEIKQTINILNNILIDDKQNMYKRLNDDTLAEVLLTLKLCGDEYGNERLLALDALSLRFDSTKLIFREHKSTSFKEEIIKNEHTNILYILNVLF